VRASNVHIKFDGDVELQKTRGEPQHRRSASGAGRATQSLAGKPNTQIRPLSVGGWDRIVHEQRFEVGQL
jgi:hypothetical protein